MFSVSKQTHSVLIACDSERATVALHSSSMNMHRSGVVTALLLGWYHVKLLPSRHSFCVHHATMYNGFFRSRICTERPNYSTLTPESKREKSVESVERVSARRSSLKGGERATVNQRNINRNCFKGTAGENGFWETDWAHMGLSQRIDAILNWRELNWTELWHVKKIAQLL